MPKPWPEFMHSESSTTKLFKIRFLIPFASVSSIEMCDVRYLHPAKALESIFAFVELTADDKLKI